MNDRVTKEASTSSFYAAQRVTTATIGGARAAHAAGRRQSQLQAEQGRTEGAPAPEEPTPFRLRFGIRQMMILTAWIGGFLALTRLTGSAAPRIVLLSTAWIVFQTLLIVLGTWAIRRWRRRA